MSFGWDPEGWADTASNRTARVLLLWAGLQSRPAMWQKYKNIKIIDYQHWHLSDLLQQAASQCFLCAQRFRFGSIPSLKSLCDIDTSASTFFPSSNRRPKALVNIINSGGKKRDRFACRTSVVNRFCGILLRLRFRRLPLKKWSCFLVLISAEGEGSSGIGGIWWGSGHRFSNEIFCCVLLRSSIMQGWQVIKNAAIFYSQQFVRRVYKLIGDERANVGLIWQRDTGDRYLKNKIFCRSNKIIWFAWISTH